MLRVLLPPNYPSGAGPVMELELQGMPEQQLAGAVKHMEDMFTPGELKHCITFCMLLVVSCITELHCQHGRHAVV